MHKPEAVLREVQLKPTFSQIEAINKVLTIMTGLGFEEVTFDYNGNLNVCAMCPSRVSMIDAQIDMGLGFGLTESQTPPPSIRKFSCRIAAIKRALRTKGTIDLKQTEAIVSTSKLEITVPLTDDSDEQIPQPKVTLNINTTVDFGEVFSEMKKYLATPPDHVILEAENGNLTLKTTTDQQKFKMTGFKCTGESGSAIYSLSYLQALGEGEYNVSYAKESILKAKKVVTDTTYSSKGSVTTKVANIVVWLAPRLETE